jgi:AcrR family transcriptional regulator
MSHFTKLSSPPRVRPQPLARVVKSDRTRAAILDTAFDFIWSHPFREMTVKSLMNQTGTVRSTFYRYFSDLHEVMEAMLEMLKGEVFSASQNWLVGAGDPIALIHETLDGLVQVCYQRGPFLRAISDAATTDKRFENAWKQFLAGFDDAGTARIESDQEQGLILDFPARPVAIALNILNAHMLIDAFGQHPRKQQEPVRKALARIWVSTLYGREWAEHETSTLVRKN